MRRAQTWRGRCGLPPSFLKSGTSYFSPTFCAKVRFLRALVAVLRWEIKVRSRSSGPSQRWGRCLVLAFLACTVLVLFLADGGWTWWNAFKPPADEIWKRRLYPKAGQDAGDGTIDFLSFRCYVCRLISLALSEQLLTTKPPGAMRKLWESSVVIEFLVRDSSAWARTPCQGTVLTPRLANFSHISAR